MTKFDGGLFARGWLSVALASSTDKERAALHRTVLIESFSEGVRLVATDSFMLLRSWVPNRDHPMAPEPEFDDRPMTSAVAMDPHGRAKGFLAHLLVLAAKAADSEHPTVVDVHLCLGVRDLVDDEDRDSFEGMDPEWITLEHRDHEMLKLQTFEGAYPEWRAVGVGFKAKRTTEVALHPDRLGALAKLEKWHAGAIGWTFGGENRMARVEVLRSHPMVAGLVMPCRWNLDDDEPWTPDDEDDEDGTDG